jgi:hypothetical protein
MMKKSVMAVGVAALLGMSAAQAVVAFEDQATFAARTTDKAGEMGYVQAGGIGHVLFTPYYSTVNGNTTLISLVNTDATMGKAVKVRFRGAANSDDVLDFTVLLSPGDVWTASIQPSLTGNARITTPDSSCVLPSQIGEDGVDFRTYRLDQKLSEAARALHTREGYIEFLNMADISPWKGRASAAKAATDVPGTKHTVYSNIKHVNNVAPCNADVASWLVSSDALANPADYGILPPTGGLFGNWAVFNNENITSYGGGHYASAAVKGTAGAGNAARLIFSPQSEAPAGVVESADPLLNADALWGASQTYRGAAVVNGTAVGTALIPALWLDLPDLSTPYTVADVSGTAFSPKKRAFDLSKALSATAVMNEFVATPESATVPFRTDWVFSQPTRRYQVAMAYSQEGSGERNIPVNALPAATYGPNYFFGSVTNVASADITGNMTLGTRSIGGVSTGDFLCTKSEIKGSNREEASFSAVGQFSPAPVAGATFFCGETATLSFNSETSKVLHAALANQQVSVRVGSGGASTVQAGWATLTLKPATAYQTGTTTALANPANGLPVIGYAATSFSNGATNGNFGDAIEHRYAR